MWGVGLSCLGVMLSGRGSCDDLGQCLGDACAVLSVGVFARVVCVASAISHSIMLTSGVCPCI
jgi:hypothetical protein